MHITLKSVARLPSDVLRYGTSFTREFGVNDRYDVYRILIYVEAYSGVTKLFKQLSFNE